MRIGLTPDRLSHWLAALTLGTILITQAFAVALYHADRVKAVDSANARVAAQCLAGFAQVLAPEPPERRRAMMKPLLNFHERERFENADPAAVEQRADPATAQPSFMIHLPNPPGPEPAADNDEPNGRARIRVYDNLPDGTGLALTAPPTLRRLFTPEFAAYLTGVLMVAALGSVWAIALATKPLRRLSEAADRFGSDVNAPPLEETGPREVRQAAAAFNRMQRRLRQFITDRTRMLAAISHDLRTPLTRMRLRAEMIADCDQRTKMLQDLAEMEEMVGGALAFARAEHEDEPTQTLDLAGLIETIVDDARLAGAPVVAAQIEPVAINGRRHALKRAIVNLADNAVRYGDGAELRLLRAGEDAVIRVIDHGSGIDEAERENVLRPFYRCEDSRSRQTGGTGLGLSIAADIVHAHGGALSLSETAGGGLTVEIRLPA
jgi:signal transduction histidine kinase